MKTQSYKDPMKARDKVAAWLVGIMIAIGMPSMIVVANAATGQ